MRKVQIKSFLIVFMVLSMTTFTHAQKKWNPVKGPKTDAIQTVFKDAQTGKWFAAVKSDSDYGLNSKEFVRFYVSDDGLTWTADSYKEELSDGRTVNYGHGLKKFIRYQDAIMGIGFSSIRKHDDSEDWAYSQSGVHSPVVIGDTLFVAVSNSLDFYKMKDPISFVNQNQPNPLQTVMSNYVMSAMGQSKGNLLVSNNGGGQNSGIAYSEDYGRTFQLATVESNDSDHEVSAFFTTDSLVFAVYHNVSSAKIIISDDGGKTWKVRAAAPSGSTSSKLYGFDSKLFLANYTGLYRSDDAGLSWNKLAYENHFINDFTHDAQTLIIAADNGILHSTDYGNTVTLIEIGETGGMFTNYTVQPDGSVYLITNAGSIYNYSEQTSTFSPISTVRTLHNVVDYYTVGSKEVLVGGVYFGEATFMRDSPEAAWNAVYPSGLNQAYGFLNSASNAVVFNDSLWMYWNIFSGKSGIYVSTQDANHVLTTTTVPSARVKQFLVVDTLLFAAVENQGLFARGTASSEWVKKNDNWRGLSYDESTLYTVGNDSIYLSTDLGETWNGVFARSLSGVTFEKIAKVDDRYFALNFQNKIEAVSIDSMKSWENHPYEEVTFLFKVNSEQIYGGSSENPGLYRYSKETTTSVEENPVRQPESFTLHQNYPNPFNPTTRIQFDLPQATLVKVEFFDVLGRRVASSHQSFYSSGSHTFTFDGGKLNSGVYFYRLTAGNFVQQRKMMLLK